MSEKERVQQAIARIEAKRDADCAGSTIARAWWGGSIWRGWAMEGVREV